MTQENQNIFIENNESPVCMPKYDSAIWVEEHYTQLPLCTHEMSCECWTTLLNNLTSWYYGIDYRHDLRIGLNKILGFRAGGMGGFSDSTLPTPVRNIMIDISFEKVCIFLDMSGMEYLARIVGKLSIMGRWEIIERLYEHNPDVFIMRLKQHDMLRRMVNFAPFDFLLELLMNIQAKHPGRIAEYRDKDRNNILHYFFFRAPWNPVGKAQKILEFLIASGLDPEIPNSYRISSQFLRTILDMYFRREKQQVKNYKSC